MGVLADNLARQIARLQQQRANIMEHFSRELTEVDQQIAALQDASGSLSKAVEDSYDQLLQLGLIQPVSRP